MPLFSTSSKHRRMTTGTRAPLRWQCSARSAPNTGSRRMPDLRKTSPATFRSLKKLRKCDANLPPANSATIARARGCDAFGPSACECKCGGPCGWACSFEAGGRAPREIGRRRAGLLFAFERGATGCTAAAALGGSMAARCAGGVCAVACVVCIGACDVGGCGCCGSADTAVRISSTQARGKYPTSRPIFPRHQGDSLSVGMSITATKSPIFNSSSSSSFFSNACVTFAKAIAGTLIARAVDGAGAGPGALACILCPWLSTSNHPSTDPHVRVPRAIAVSRFRYCDACISIAAAWAALGGAVASACGRSRRL
eukprot:Opistho-2@31638